MIYPVVMAGQANSVVPAGEERVPAHFFAEAMIESRFQSVIRCLDHPMFAAPTVVTCEANQGLAAQQMCAVGVKGSLLVEPGLSKSAAALAAVALRFRDAPDALLLIMPASHSCASEGRLLQTLEAALPAAKQGGIVAVATRDHGSYGRLRTLSRRRGQEPMQALYSAGVGGDEADPDVLWNSGIYLVRAGSLLAAFKRHAPRILHATKAAVAGIAQTEIVRRLVPDAYGKVKQESFEAAVLGRVEIVDSVQLDHNRSIWEDWIQDMANEKAEAGAARRRAKRQRAA
ncbi:hypothetical protein PXK58_17845 [Phaeobacter gallaeciensis]|uniref:hypothetical protein n=1 Tax=Phaeobacter TaxID=302485 RepID=UPI00237FEDE1|nr:hypothetical protein [Phaeobacter gallaeciensis]MDE4276197.1 hypothetical protein [Phaeobacter gallaeciensis]MDE4301426.1 hypothetical protein [Phaeobacter gallaeciensis]MDE5186581.1 hypothetical protein [Phaeobacter gallaeciensis]